MPVKNPTSCGYFLGYFHSHYIAVSQDSIPYYSDTWLIWVIITEVGSTPKISSAVLALAHAVAAASESTDPFVPMAVTLQASSTGMVGIARYVLVTGEQVT